MPRMRWRPLDFFALLSAVLLLAVLLAWARSHEEPWGVKFGPMISVGADWQFYAASIQSQQGGVWVQTLSASTPQSPSSHTYLDRLGFRAASGDVLLAQPSAYVHTRAVRLPYWFVVCTAMVLPVMWLRGLRRARLRARAGHCPACGYDMRITPEQCPECGLVVVQDVPDEEGVGATSTRLGQMHYL